MRVSFLSAAIVAVALTASGEADAVALETRGGTPLSQQKNFGAVGYPWQQSSTPGWYKGNGDCPLTPWDRGNAFWCQWWPYSWSSYCRSGNPTKKPASPRKNDWGVHGKPNFPRPWWNKGNGIKSPVKTTTVATKTVTTVVPVTTTATVTTAVPTTVTTAVSTTITTTVTSVEVTSTIVPAATGVPVGPKDDGCTDGYQQVFFNYTTIADSGVYYGQVVGAAVVDNANYLTYGLSDTAEGCLDVCDDVTGCAFVNSYIDHGDLTEGDVGGKYAGLFTCALYSICESSSTATNWGGQQDPSYITDSAGWCKSGACSS